MDRILGQTRAVEVLQAQLGSGRLHHAYIFHGPTGVGKFTTATAFAQILLCHAPTKTLTGEVEACGQCVSCQFFNDAKLEENEASDDLDVGTHPDLHIITKELARYSEDKKIRDRKLTQIPVEVLRSTLLDPASRAAHFSRSQDMATQDTTPDAAPGVTPGAGRKIFIVDEAELLNATGQNLLLKTLEEPPTGTVIILITSSEDQLLPTIRSRCQRVAFTPLPNEVISRWLEQREETPDLSDRERRWLLAFAGGSLGRAGLVLDYGLVEWARSVLPELERMAAGRGQGSLGGQMAQLIDALAKAWVDRYAKASKEAANKLAAGLMWSLVAGYARRKLSLAVEQCQGIEPIHAQAAVEPWLEIIDALPETQRLLASNVNLSLTCDHLASKITRAMQE